jgi:hypothetical protein
MERETPLTPIMASPSRVLAISGDGLFVAFASAHTNLVAGDANNGRDVFVHDRTSGANTRVSVATVVRCV